MNTNTELTTSTNRFIKTKKVGTIIGITAVLLTLAGCSSEPTPPPTANNPISVKEADYEQYYTQLPGHDVIISCFEDGFGQTRVLTCFEVPNDIPQNQIKNFDTLGFGNINFVDAGQGVTVACIEDGWGKTRVLTCFNFNQNSY